MAGLAERLDQAERIIRTPNFRQNKGLGNEVGYYVFDYPADKELIIRERIEYMKAKNSKVGISIKYKEELLNEKH